jgi:MFS family permease
MSTFVGLLLNVWIGHLSEKGDKALWVFWPGFISRLLVCGALIWVSPWVFLMVLGASNIIGTFGGPAYNSLMRSNYSHRNRGRLMGIIRIGIQVVSALAAAFAGWFMEFNHVGYQILFPVAGALGMCSSWIFFRIKARRPPLATESRAAMAIQEPPEGFRASLALIARDKLFLVYMAIYFVAGFPDKLLVPLEPIRFIDELGMNYGAAGLIQGTIPLMGAMAGYFIFIKLAHKVSPFILLMATAVLASSRFLNTAVATNPYHLIPGAFLNGMGNAGWDLLPLFSIMLFVGHQRISLYFGFFSTLVGVRGLIGPVLGSWMYSAGWRIADIYWLAFWLELGAVVLLFGFLLYFQKRKHTIIAH